MKKSKKSKNDGQLTPEDIIKSYLDKNDEEGINEFEKSANNDYLVSTGSLKFDQKVGGGLGPGIIRFVGPTESGKTSEALEIAKNFLNLHKNSKVIYFKCEGRLSQKILDRSGVDQERFEVIKGRECSLVFGLMKSLIRDTRGINYCFIVDSTDALTIKANNGKDDESEKRVGGGSIPAIMAQLLPQISDITHELGHMCIMLSQHRDEIVIGYQKKTKNVGASGGNALLHYADWTFEYELVRNMDLIMENEGKDKEKMRVIGHTSRVVIKKSMNETTHEVVHYPIRRKSENGKSIWLEREVYDLLLMYDLVKKKGGWFNFDEEIFNTINEESQNRSKAIDEAIKDNKNKELILKGISDDLEEEDQMKLTKILAEDENLSKLINDYFPQVPDKMHGEDKVLDILDSNPALINFLIDIFKKHGILN